MAEPSLFCSSDTRKHHTFNIPSIESILGASFTTKNSVKILKSGDKIFQPILDSISTAEKIICIEFYIFKDDDTGNKLAGLLKEKSMQGVKVYVLYDHFGSLLTSGRFWSDMKKAGVKFRASHPIKLTSFRRNIYRNHKKLIIVDGKRAFTGGFNIADEYYGYFNKKQPAWRDIGICLEGPIVNTLFELFKKSWRRWKGSPITTDIEHQVLTEGIPAVPIFASTGRDRRRMRRLLLQSINNAEESILITTAYFLPSRRLIKALQHSARKGVKIKLLLPGKSDVQSAYYASRSHYKKLLTAGVEVYNYQGSILHSKTAVFDSCWSIIGSTNLDFQSLRRNDEGNIGLLDKGFSKRMETVFHSDLKESVRINPDTWSKRSLLQKIMEKSCLFFIKVFLK